MTPPPRTAETLLIDALPQLTGARVLCTSLGRAQFAAAYAKEHTASRVTCHFLDVHLADLARQAVAEHTQVTIACQSDFPEGEVDLAVLPCSMNGTAELTRELLQQAHERLCLGGRLAAATDNPSDQWLQTELHALFDKVTRQDHATGVVFLATKTKSLKKRKNFACEFAFRDQERLFKIISRPGVFSHRRLDLGARALMEVMQLHPGERVLEIGCGCGTVTVVAGERVRHGTVHAIDSNPRAVECTQRSAELNGLRNISVKLNAKGTCDEPGAYDVALANPPYYSHHRLAEIFVQGAQQALRRGGRMYLVTKHPAWYEATLPQWFSHVEPQAQRGYWVFACTRS